MMLLLAALSGSQTKAPGFDGVERPLLHSIEMLKTWPLGNATSIGEPFREAG